jgi:acetyltransferase-like isoleucine patch superfamily enzyme
MFLKKLFTVIRHRPTYFVQYARGTCLFFLTRFLQLFLLDRKRIDFHPTARSQSIMNFLAGSEMARISVGANSITYENARCEVYDSGVLSIGESSILGDIKIACRQKITLGKRTLTSWNVLIQDYDSHPTSHDLRAKHVTKMAADFTPRFGKKPETESFSWEPSCAEIYIGDDVWLAANVIILKGVRIGSGSIVAAGSVVTAGEFPERSLIAGNPAKFIRELSK